MDKKELTIEELEAKYQKIFKEFKNIEEQLTKKKKEEEEKKKAQLAREKEARSQEIEAVAKHYCELVKAYQKDYGCYHYCAKNGTHKTEDFDIMSHLWNMIFEV